MPILPLLAIAPAVLSLRTASGGSETLYPAKDRRATVVVVVIADCPIAQKYSPALARLAVDYAPKGVRFLMAFADADAPAMRAHMKSYGLPFPAARADRRLIGLLQATAVPTAAIVGAKGQLAYVGRIDDRFPALGVQRKPRRADLRIALDQFLSGQAVRPSRTPVVGCVLPNGKSAGFVQDR